MSKPAKAYKNLEFLNSPEARTVRILCEYEEPKRRFEQHNVEDTVVCFGSARTLPVVDAERLLAEAKASGDADAITQAEGKLRSSRYYEDARAFAREMTQWSQDRGGRDYLICTGGGPGIMEAANRGAADVPGGRSIGLGISLPFEEGLNPYITPGLDFEFHYFFTRKYWFMYLAKALVVFPGGFGTFDELMELLTLVQTGKVKKQLPIVLFGTEYWNDVLNVEKMVEWGTISPKDLDLMYRSDSVADTVAHLTAKLEEEERA